MVIASPSTGLRPIYVGRAIAGLAVGAASNLGPIYIAEISVPSIGGQLVGLYEIGWRFGGPVGFFINYGVAVHIPDVTRQWCVPFAVQLILGGLLVIGAVFLVESPRWLLQRGKRAAAARALSKIRKLDETHPCLAEELGEMTAAVEHEQLLDGIWASFRRTFLVKKVLWSLVLGSSLFAFQNGTGINAIKYYSPTVFNSLSITGANTGLLTNGIFGVIKTVGSFIWIFFLIDLVGRRRILFFGSAGGAAAMLAIAIYIAVDKPAQRLSSAGIDVRGRSALTCFYI